MAGSGPNATEPIEPRAHAPVILTGCQFSSAIIPLPEHTFPYASPPGWQRPSENVEPPSVEVYAAMCDHADQGGLNVYRNASIVFVGHNNLTAPMGHWSGHSYNQLALALEMYVEPLELRAIFDNWDIPSRPGTLSLGVAEGDPKSGLGIAEARLEGAEAEIVLQNHRGPNGGTPEIFWVHRWLFDDEGESWISAELVYRETTSDLITTVDYSGETALNELPPAPDDSRTTYGGEYMYDREIVLEYRGTGT